MRGGPRRHARRHRRARRRSRQGEPAAARGTGHRPLRAGGPLRDRQRDGAERRPRIPPQPRALRVPALGPDGVPQLPRRAARNRHRAPGQHRVPGACRLPRRTGRCDHRLPGHGVRHRLAHDDGERAGRGRLGRRWHRSRGRHARAAELDADSRRAGLPAHRPPARRRHRHRSRADDHRERSARKVWSASSWSSTVPVWRT